MKTAPDISIVIPVWHERATINATLDGLQRQSHDGPVEVIVVDAHPGGSTLQAIDAGSSPGFTMRTVQSEKGRGRQMNRGAEIATAPVLLFLHADTHLPADAFQAVLGVLKNPQIVGGAFDLQIRSNHWGYRVIETMGSIRSRLTRLPYGDQAIFLRKVCFDHIGGFAPFPIMEDVDLMQRIKKQGGRIHIFASAVRTDPRRWEKDGMIYGTLRNWILMILFLAGVSPHRLVKWYP